MRHGSASIWAPATLALCLGCAGCGDDGGSDDGASSGGAGGTPSACGLGFLGDSSKPVEMTVTARGADLSSKELSEGGSPPMMLPPQGGRVMFIGVRATNIGPCGVELTGTLRDLSSGQVRIDSRKTHLEPTGDGWGTSVDTDISTFAMIPTCPNQWASSDVYGNTFELELSVLDKDGRTATKKLNVVPTCGEPADLAECQCQCKKGYTLGQACN